MCAYAHHCRSSAIWRMDVARFERSAYEMAMLEAESRMKPHGVFSVPPPPLPPSINPSARCPGCCRPWNDEVVAGVAGGGDDDDAAAHGSLLPPRDWVQGAPRRLLLWLLWLVPPAAALVRPLAPMVGPPIDVPVKQAHMWLVVAAAAVAAAPGSSRREDDAVAAAAVKPRTASRPIVDLVGGGC